MKWNMDHSVIKNQLKWLTISFIPILLCAYLFNSIFYSHERFHWTVIILIYMLLPAFAFSILLKYMVRNYSSIYKHNFWLGMVICLLVGVIIYIYLFYTKYHTNVIIHMIANFYVILFVFGLFEMYRLKLLKKWDCATQKIWKKVE